jgi:hypothetical protein
MRDTDEVGRILAAAGIAPGPNGYDQATLLRAIAARHWDLRLEGHTGAWSAELRKPVTTTQALIGQARGYETPEDAIAHAMAALLDLLRQEGAS